MYETGERGIDLPALERIAEALEVTMNPDHKAIY